MANKPTFSIIICVYVPNKRFYIDLNKYLSLKYRNYEIILVMEKNQRLGKISFPVKMVKSSKSKVSLGEKRDLGFRASSGEYCAFIDDDAYPDELWLSSALKIFNSDQKIGAVGGPNITPLKDSFWQKIGGYIYESYLTSGEAQYRFLPKKRKFVAELQGVNLIIKKDVLERLGGFKSRLYSGDDSKVCSNIRSVGYKLVYDPHVVVYHHRRAFPFAHLKQIRNMGTHRGFFVKAYPQTLSPMYFLPSVLTLGFSAGLVFSIMFKEVRLIFLYIFMFFYVLGVSSTVKKSGLVKSIFVSVGIIMTHITYGIYFIRGLLLKKVERQEVES